jgi:hypothetical protein
MHVSGHGLVEWVQRYTCAKLSETILLAGEWVFYKGNLQYIRYFIVILIRYLLCYQVQYFSYQVRQALYQNLQFLITLTHTLSHLNKLSPTWTHSHPSEHTLTHLNTLSPTLTHSLPPEHTLSHLSTPSPTCTHNYMQKRWHPTHTSTPLPGLLKGPSYSYQVLQGRPREKPTIPVNLSSPPNSKPPIPHLNAKYLMLSKWLTFAGNLASWGVLWARWVFCTHFGRKKVHF